MLKRVSAAVLAATIALTSLGTAPARAADSGEIARAILGLGVAAIIIHEASKNKNKGHGTVTRRVTPHYSKVVPSQCLRHNKWDNGPRKFFGKRCLNKNMHNANHLPSACKRTVWTPKHKRTVYGARCLRKNGWTFG